ncbi:MAG: lipid II:glycine glycyltransferase FemX [Actinomycetes bacterium]|jgi:lipid II:glycine glycyltransferase (peptidoglycan interpeptide bridge formation enzyme)
MSLILKEIDKETHVEFLKNYQTFSFLQLPCWAEVKSGWKSKSVGWFDERKLVCVGLILIRNIPKTKWSLFYLPEGPVLDPDYAKNVVDWLTPLRDFAKESGAFNLKLGPQVTINTWSAATIKSAISDNVYRQFKDVDPDRVNPFGHEIGTKLRNLGGKQIETDGEGFGDVQPRFVFAIDVEGKSDEELLATFSQEWRRNIKKAEKSEVKVRQANFSDLETFHTLYKETAKRDKFTPRPLNYFKQMWKSLNENSNNLAEMRLYIAEQENICHAACLWVRVGKHVWYTYGASSTSGRELRPSNAIQWQMMRDARDAGASIYDMRGIAATLNEKSPLFGLLRFKIGTGGKVIQYVGEWDFVLKPLIYKAFRVALARRG